MTLNDVSQWFIIFVLIQCTVHDSTRMLWDLSSIVPHRRLRCFLITSRYPKIFVKISLGRASICVQISLVWSAGKWSTVLPSLTSDESPCCGWFIFCFFFAETFAAVISSQHEAIDKAFKMEQFPCASNTFFVRNAREIWNVVPKMVLRYFSGPLFCYIWLPWDERKRVVRSNSTPLEIQIWIVETRSIRHCGSKWGVVDRSVWSSGSGRRHRVLATPRP